MEPPSRGESGNESAKKLTAIHNKTKHMDDVYLVRDMWWRLKTLAEAEIRENIAGTHEIA